MATRTQQYKTAAERTHVTPAKKPARRKPTPAQLKVSRHAAVKATYALEEGGARKSTRGSSPLHIKPDAALRNRAVMRTRSASARKGRGKSPN